MRGNEIMWSRLTEIYQQQQLPREKFLKQEFEDFCKTLKQSPPLAQYVYNFLQGFSRDSKTVVNYELVENTQNNHLIVYHTTTKSLKCVLVLRQGRKTLPDQPVIDVFSYTKATQLKYGDSSFIRINIAKVRAILDEQQGLRIQQNGGQYVEKMYLDYSKFAAAEHAMGTVSPTATRYKTTLYKLHNLNPPTDSFIMHYAGISIYHLLKETRLFVSEALDLGELYLQTYYQQVYLPGVVHNDLRLDNVFLDPLLQRMSIGDWGSAYELGEVKTTMTGTTYGYMAPEVTRQCFAINGKKIAYIKNLFKIEPIQSHAIDIYGLAQGLIYILGGLEALDAFNVFKKSVMLFMPREKGTLPTARVGANTYNLSFTNPSDTDQEVLWNFLYCHEGKDSITDRHLFQRLESVDNLDLLKVEMTTLITEMLSSDPAARPDINTIITRYQAIIAKWKGTQPAPSDSMEVCESGTSELSYQQSQTSRSTEMETTAPKKDKYHTVSIFFQPEPSAPIVAEPISATTSQALEQRSLAT